MTNHGRRRSRTILSRLQEINRRRAREKGGRIRADELAPSVERYIEWRAFVLWARAIAEAEGAIPTQVADALERRCPTFDPEARTDAEPEFWLRLCRWIDDNIFRQAKEEGWLIAVEYYASRDMRWEQLWLYWEHCDHDWQKLRPRRYPHFEEWHLEAQWWRFPPSKGKQTGWDGADRVSPEQLKKAVADYQDWEALAYWVRALVRGHRAMPPMVAGLLRERCPGFLEQLTVEGVRLEDSTTVWRRLIAWIDDNVFGSAKREGWFEAITLFARMSLRGERTVAYWAACDRAWTRRRPTHFPNLEEWTRAVDAYTER